MKLGLFAFAATISLLQLPAMAGTYRFTVVTANGENLTSPAYGTLADCDFARNDYIRYTDPSEYKSVGQCN